MLSNITIEKHLQEILRYIPLESIGDLNFVIKLPNSLIRFEYNDKEVYSPLKYHKFKNHLRLFIYNNLTEFEIHKNTTNFYDHILNGTTFKTI